MKKQLLRAIVIGISFTFIFSIKAFAVTLVGDFNGDSDVNITDLALLAAKYGTNDSNLDLNKDGIIDINDIVRTAKQIQEYDYKVVDTTGIIKSGYNKGQLLAAVYQANSLEQGTIFSSGQVLWDKSNGFKKKIGYAQYMLYLRYKPTSDPAHSAEVPEGAILELEYRTNGYYKVKYNDNGTIKEGYVKRFVDIVQDDLGDSLLGYVSETYESNGDPGVISTGAGDAGGKSYGAWQLASKVGSVDNFLIWLKTSKIEFYNTLIEAKKADGGTFGTKFDESWKSLANNYYDEFYGLQRTYIKATYYDIIINKLKASGVDYTSRLNSVAIRNMLWSLSVQHGPTGGFNIANIYKNTYVDKDFINSIYDERSKVDIYFKGCPDSTKEAVKNRFTHEKADCIRIYDKEIGY